MLYSFIHVPSRSQIQQPLCNNLRQSTRSCRTPSAQYSSSPLTPARLRRRQPTSLGYSQMRSAWRKSSLRHAPLWTNVLLGVQGDQSLERSTEFLRRSKSLPVCLMFDMQGTREEPPGPKERLAFLSPYEHRLRALHIQGAVTAVPIHRFLHDLDYTFTNLKDFQITWGKPTTRRAKPFPVSLGTRFQKHYFPITSNSLLTTSSPTLPVLP